MSREKNKAAANSPDLKGIVGQLSRIRELANRFIEGELAHRGVVGILPAHGAVLNFLFAQPGPVPIKELVRHTGRVKSTVTQVVAGLERSGYLTKAASAEDSRVILVALTEAGRQLQDQFVEISDALEARVYGDMPLETRQQLVNSLSILEGNLRR